MQISKIGGPKNVNWFKFRETHSLIVKNKYFLVYYNNLLFLTIFIKFA